MKKRMIASLLAISLLIGIVSQINIAAFAETPVIDHLPSATVVSGNHVYTIYEELTDWTAANDFCKNTAGNLVSITSQEEQNIINNMLTGKTSNYWIGATDTQRQVNDFLWTTGEKFTYSNWLPNEPNNNGGNEDFVAINNGKWSDLPGTSKFGFIKESVFDANVVATKTSNGHQYLLVDKSLTWYEANEYCKYLKGNLMSVGSAEEQQILTELVKSGAKTYYFLGGTDSGSEGTWRWLDNTPWSYTNWVGVQPDNWQGNENYLVAYKSSGEWNDIANNSLSLYNNDSGFVCEIPIKYSIAFDSNGGVGTMQSMDFKFDETKAITENSFSKTGYYFDGWNTKSDATGTSYSNSQMVKNLTQENGVTLTLYAIWKPSQTTVSFDANGGSAVEYKTYAYDSTYGELPTPTKKGFVFDGWYTSNDFKTKISTATKVTSSHILYAKWVEKSNYAPIDINVSSAFSNNGGKAKVFINISKDSKMAAGLFKIKYDNTKLKVVSTDMGTVLKDGYSSKTAKGNGEILLSYAHTKPLFYEGKMLEIEFEVISPVPQGTSFVETDISLEIIDLKSYDYCEIPANIKNGKVTIIETKFGDVNNLDSVTPTDALMTLTAAAQLLNLTPEQTIRADVNGDGKVTSLDAMLILQFSAGDISNYPIFNIQAPENLRVEAKGETSFTLIWDAVEFIKGYNVYKDGIKLNSEPITNASYNVTGLSQDTNYDLCVEAVNTLKSSQKSQTIKVSTNKADRTITFKDFDGKILDTKTVLSGLAVTPPTDPIRAGYTFIGWDKQLNNITEDAIVTATYKINNYTATFDSCGGSAIVTQAKDYGSLLDVPANPTKPDYTFDGWYLDSTYVKKWDFTTDKITMNTVLYAKWITWSEWQTEIPQGIDESKYTIQSKKEYRSRTKSTTTGASNSMNGWILYDSKITYWTEWSAWQNSPVGATASREVRTQWIDAVYKTVWKYHRWVNKAGDFSSNTSWGDKIYHQAIQLDYRLKNYGLYQNIYRYGDYVYNGNTYLRRMWWNETSESVLVARDYTQFSYRDGIYTHYFYKWSAWSDWSVAEKVADANTEAEARTVYRYLLKQN